MHACVHAHGGMHACHMRRRMHACTRMEAYLLCNSKRLLFE